MAHNEPDPTQGLTPHARSASAGLAPVSLAPAPAGGAALVLNSRGLISEQLTLVVVAVQSWTGFRPPLKALQTLSPGPILAMYARNLISMTLVAGGLHLRF